MLLFGMQLVALHRGQGSKPFLRAPRNSLLRKLLFRLLLLKIYHARELCRSQRIVSFHFGDRYVDNLRYLVALWTFELDILGRNRHFWLPHQA